MSWWNRDKHERDLDEEIQAHLNMAGRDRQERGESPGEARRNARREFGNEALIKETTRSMSGWVSVDQVMQDLRFAFRQIRRNPGDSRGPAACVADGIRLRRVTA